MSLPWLSASKRRKVADGASNGTSTGTGTGTQDNDLESKVIVPKLEGIAKLLVQMQDPDLVEDSLSKLLKCFDHGNESEKRKNRLLASELGATTMLVCIMRKCQLRQDVQLLCCKNLVVLTFEAKAARISFIEMGGVEAILSAMNIFPQSSELCDSGFCVFTNCFSGNDDEADAVSRDKVMKRFVEELGGLELIEKTMKEYPQCVKLQFSCCGLLCNLSTNSKFHKPMVKAGLVGRVGATLQLHFNDDKVKDAAKAFNKQVCSKTQL